jgi:DNA-directed RNA polymerase specialized sigma24 family protein
VLLWPFRSIEWPATCLSSLQAMQFFSDTSTGNSAGMMVSRSAAVSQSIIVQVTRYYNASDERRDVFESHRHHIFSVAYYMTGDEREAETILQSTFIEAFDRQIKPSIAMLDEALMTQLHRRLSLDPVPAAEAGTEGLGNRNVRRTDMEEALWQMPERERLCFLLRDVEGYDAGRIAGLLATSEKEVQCTIFSARLRMRNLLMEQRMKRLRSSRNA